MIGMSGLVEAALISGDSSYTNEHKDINANGEYEPDEGVRWDRVTVDVPQGGSGELIDLIDSLPVFWGLSLPYDFTVLMSIDINGITSFAAPTIAYSNFKYGIYDIDEAGDWKWSNEGVLVSKISIPLKVFFKILYRGNLQFILQGYRSENKFLKSKSYRGFVITEKPAPFKEIKVNRIGLEGTSELINFGPDNSNGKQPIVITLLNGNGYTQNTMVSNGVYPGYSISGFFRCDEKQYVRDLASNSEFIFDEYNSTNERYYSFSVHNLMSGNVTSNTYKEAFDHQDIITNLGYQEFAEMEVNLVRSFAKYLFNQDVPPIIEDYNQV